jgi:hypothetical protein
MTAAKLKPLILFVSGFALSNVANIFIFMILDYFTENVVEPGIEPGPLDL